MRASHLASLGGLATGGIWYCRAWAFRLDLALVVCALALDLLWLALSFTWDLFELGPVLLLVFSGVILSLFLEPAVARAMVVKRPRKQAFLSWMFSSPHVPHIHALNEMTSQQY